MPPLKATFSGKLAIQQRVLTVYRAAFFDTLAEACQGGLSVFAGLPRAEESIAVTDQLKVAYHFPANNLHILSGSLYMCYQRGLPAWLGDWNPDILILEANPRYLATPAAFRWMKRQNRPVVGWGLGASQIAGALANLHKNLRQMFIMQFDALLTYSRQGANEYAGLGFPADKIFVAPNAMTNRPLAPLSARRPYYAGRPHVLFVGRLQARKRVDLLLQACASLPESIQPLLIIVGDGPERSNLENLAKQVYPNAEFIGAKHGAELAPYFLDADIFILPGTGGLAVQEAMSYGLPVIMGKGDGTNDDLVRPGNGWRIEDGNLHGLRIVMEEALCDVERLRKMGAESYRIVSEEINLERMMTVFLQVLDRMTSL